MILNEEKPTKYFYFQEKQKQIKKSINKLIDNEDNILQNNTDILNECKNSVKTFMTNKKHAKQLKTNYYKIESLKSPKTKTKH